MPENPLLPNRRLKELLELMRRAHALDLRSKRPAREALVAATAIHLLPGDLLNSDAADLNAIAFAPAANPNVLAKGKAAVMPEANVALPRVSRLALCAAMAQGLRSAGTGGIVLAHINTASPEAGWADALEYAHRARLPLLVAVADPTAGRAGRTPTALSLASVSRLAKKLQLPVLPVDGEDAVAVYRVMQECTLRARLGEGPAVIWGILTPQNKQKLSRAMQPISRMEKYLAVRGLLPAKTSRKSRA